MTACLRQGLPVVCGSTGWLHHFEEARALTEEVGGSLFYASNYSVGVNLFFHFNEYIAGKMSQFGGYDVAVREIHHTQKIDQPSGTALTTAEGILRQFPTKTTWRNAPAEADPPSWPLSASASAIRWAPTSLPIPRPSTRWSSSTKPTAAKALHWERCWRPSGCRAAPAFLE